MRNTFYSHGEPAVERRGLLWRPPGVVIEVRLKDDCCGVHVDVTLGVAAFASGCTKPLRRLHGRERLVPEYDLFAGSLPQPLREIVEALLVAAAGPSGHADDERVGVELAPQRVDFREDVALIEQDGMGRRENAGIADGDADSPRAIVDADDRHGADCKRRTARSGGTALQCSFNRLGIGLHGVRRELLAPWCPAPGVLS
jgi:hypothetical protein